MNTGKTVFSQLISFLPEKAFAKCVEKYKGDFGIKRFKCREHLIVMIFAQLTSRESLRDIESCLTAFSQKLYHCGLKNSVARSTLAEANEKRNWQIYADLAQILIKTARPLYFNDKEFRLDIDKIVYAFDSSTIDLCLNLFPWAKFRQNKGAVKMHTLLDLRGSIPTFIHLTNGNVHDVKALDCVPIEAGAYYLMDKGYVDFNRLYKLIHLKRAFFVTRAKSNMIYETIAQMPVDQETGVIKDEIIKLIGLKTAKDYPEYIRMVTYEDFATNTVYNFLTNDFELSSLTIAELYRERWKVELFFKWIKQHLRIKSFYGTSQNAVYCQIWIAVCSYLLIAIMKKRIGLDQSLYTLSQTIGLTLFEKVPLKELFENNVINLNSSDDNQLSIW